MTNIHLIVGNVGAGKSTYARRLAGERRAHLFQIDEWMRGLFYPDRTEETGYEWMLDRVRRCDERITAEAVGLAALGLESVLDLGFFGRAQRDFVRGRIAEAGQRPILHLLDVDKATRWSRVEARNTGTLAPHEVTVSRETFEFCETIYEPPQGVERDGMVVADG